MKQFAMMSSILNVYEHKSATTKWFQQKSTNEKKKRTTHTEWWKAKAFKTNKKIENLFIPPFFDYPLSHYLGCDQNRGGNPYIL